MTRDNADASAFSIADIRRRADARLLARPATDDTSDRHGDHALNPGFSTRDSAGRAPAAVLAPIVDRPEGPTVLLTVRSSKLSKHSGQIAFPGGRLDAGETPLEAALREAEEEIGLDRRFVTPIGYLAPYLTGTGFRVHAAVAIVAPGFSLSLNPHEVDDAFETPFAFLMNPDNHRRIERVIDGVDRHFYAMPWGERYIWGATAGMLRNLYLRLYAS
jgi:8-oxo-dGTP pyrophosphatase MutT (NUDIX family)